MSAASPDVALSELGQIAFTVRDVAESTRFFRDVLRLPFLFAAGENLAFFQAGTTRLMLTLPQGAGTVGQNSVLYFKVADIHVAHAAVVARGARDERGPALAAKLPDHELWLAFIRDPDGNLIGLMSEVRS